MLLLTSVTLLVLHGVNLCGDILKFISQVIYVIYKSKDRMRTTGSHVFSPRRFVDRFELVSYLIAEGNTCFLGAASGKAHRYSILTFKVVAEIIARLSLRLIDLGSVFVGYLQNEFSRIELQKQLYFSHLPLSPRTKHRAGLQSCPLPKYTVRLHFSMLL